MAFKPSFRLDRNLSEEGLRTSRSDKRNVFIPFCEPQLMKILASEVRRESVFRKGKQPIPDTRRAQASRNDRYIANAVFIHEH